MKRCIAEDLIVRITDAVPETVYLPEDTMQGWSISTVDPLTLAESKQTVLQYYTGGNGGHFVCMLDFEDWGSEQCPRFAYYIADVVTNRGTTYRLVRVSSQYDWKKVDDGE